LRELSSAIGAPHKLLEELASKGVLKGCDKGSCEAYVYRPVSGRVMGAPVTLVPETQGPVWYSTRMVRDEYVRENRGVSTRFTASPKASPTHSPTQRQGERQGDGSTSSSSSSSTDLKNTTAAKAARARAVARPVTISEPTWNDFLQLRRAKKAPLTAAAIAGIEREAIKAGWQLEAALIECCSRGWTGFKAEWVNKPAANNQPGAGRIAKAMNSLINGGLHGIETSSGSGADQVSSSGAEVRAIAGRIGIDR
jgi:hypothetical protein